MLHKERWLENGDGLFYSKKKNKHGLHLVAQATIYGYKLIGAVKSIPKE